MPFRIQKGGGGELGGGGGIYITVILFCERKVDFLQSVTVCPVNG